MNIPHSLIDREALKVGDTAGDLSQRQLCAWRLPKSGPTGILAERQVAFRQVHPFRCQPGTQSQKGSRCSPRISAKHQQAQTFLFSCILLPVSAGAFMSLRLARREFGEQSAPTTPSENLAINTNTVNWSLCGAPGFKVH